MTTMKAIVEGIQKDSKPQMQEQRYNGFRNQRWNNNAPSNVQTNNRREICWNRASPAHYCRDCPQNNQGNDQWNSCQGQTASEPVSP